MLVAVTCPLLRLSARTPHPHTPLGTSTQTRMHNKLSHCKQSVSGKQKCLTSAVRPRLCSSPDAAAIAGTPPNTWDDSRDGVPFHSGLSLARPSCPSPPPPHVHSEPSASTAMVVRAPAVTARMPNPISSLRSF